VYFVLCPFCFRDSNLSDANPSLFTVHDSRRCQEKHQRSVQAFKDERLRTTFLRSTGVKHIKASLLLCALVPPLLLAETDIAAITGTAKLKVFLKGG
jgi:hypothetical protein